MSITYTKTRNGEWVGFGPAAEMPGLYSDDDPGRARADGPLITITKASGQTVTRQVEKYGRVFSRNGVPHAYAYLAPEITRFRGEPAHPQAPGVQAPRPAARGELAATGVYRHADTVYVVREFTPQGEPGRKVRYARRLAELSAAQGNRVNDAGEAVRFQEVKAPGMQYQLTPAELLSVDEVERLSLATGYCLVCGRKLRVEASVKSGIGPVCAGRQRERLAERAPAVALDEIVDPAITPPPADGVLDELVAWATH